MKKINYLDSINRPIITEKATILSEQNKTVFKGQLRVIQLVQPNSRRHRHQIDH